MMLDDDGGQMLRMTMAVTLGDASVDAMQASSRTSECRCLLICWSSGPQGHKLMKLLSSCSRGDIQSQSSRWQNERWDINGSLSVDGGVRT
jgi:hypothetical protein